MSRILVSIVAVVSSLLMPTATVAAGCPENPQALGTHRVVSVNPRNFPMVGRAQYPESLRLNPREVVLTFDNGPSYPYTESILKTLATECVKATFFTLGSRVTEDPEQARRIVSEGHSIGAQTFNHVSLSSLTVADARKEIDEGIKALTSALGVGEKAIPYFRAPMLQLSVPLARYVVTRGMMVWSIDVDSRDWSETSEEQIIQQVMIGLQRTGGGIVAFQDIQPATARALPALLEELKRQKYRIVHVVANQPVARAQPQVKSRRSN